MWKCLVRKQPTIDNMAILIIITDLKILKNTIMGMYEAGTEKLVGGGGEAVVSC